MMTDDSTLGGYLDAHGSPPTFLGIDGKPYSVEIYVDDEAHDDGRFGAAALFVRWAAATGRPDGHLETHYLSFGETQAQASAGVRSLTLHELKQHLDQAIEGRRELPDW